MGRVFAAVCSALLAAAPASAVTLTFTDSASFLAALPGPPSTLDFESLAPGTLIPSGSGTGGITFTYSLGGETLKVVDVYDTTSGTNSAGLTGGDDALLDGDVVQLSFAPVAAIGLFLITSDPAVAGEIQLVTPAGTALGSATPEATLGDGGLAYFVGLVSTDSVFSTATLDFDDDAEINFTYVLDDVTTAVPEPGSVGLLALGLVGLALRRRARP